LNENKRQCDPFATAAVLAGGKSSRMGFDKQLLEIERKKLFCYTAESLNTVFPDVLFVTSSPSFYGSLNVRTCSDIYKDMGPMGGIHSALIHTESEYIFLMACDMPVVDIEYIKYLKTQALGYDACVTVNGGRYEPFCAFYSKKVLPVLERDLSEGKTSLYYFLQSVNLKTISEDKARSFNPNLTMFTNLNTQNEYNEYLKKVKINGYYK
jgi:molybdopterin-guanine dinucleotide biosynthesis protein A